MQRLRFVLGYSLVSFVGLVVTTPAAMAQPATGAKPKFQWQSDFGKAQKEAQKLGRPLLLHFYAEWCGPCKKMEKEYLGSSDFVRQISDRFVAVKINADKNLDLLERYDVQSLPTDIILEPEGRVIIGRSEGYQSRHDYLTRVAKADARWTQKKKQYIAGSTQPKDGKSSGGPQLGGPSLASPNGGARKPPINAPDPKQEKPTPDGPQEDRRIVDSPSAAPNGSGAEEFVGLDGFSPVMLARERKWLKGEAKHTVAFRGIKYWVRDTEEVTAFNRYPERFAPRLLGCDPVVLWKSDRALQGSTQFGAFYAGELYLFVSAESRDEFKVRPERYIRSRHVVRPEQIDRTAIRRAAAEPATSAR